LTYIKYSLDFLRPIITAEAFEAVDWLADLPQQIWQQASDVILFKSTAAISAAAMFVGDRTSTTASTSLAGAAAVGRCLVCKHGSHMTGIPKADWLGVKNKQLTATPC